MKTPKIQTSKADLQRLYQTHGTLAKVGEVLGVAPLTVRRALEKHGIPIGAWRGEQKVLVTGPQLRKLYLKLGSLNAVAVELGVSKKAVLNHMKAHGIERTPNESRLDEATVRALAPTHNSVQMARIFDCTPENVRVFCERRGIRYATYFKGQTITRAGYVLVYAPEHPYATRKGYVRQHRLVMEQHIGRLLEPHEVVHHVDEDTLNNDISNLDLMSNGEHVRLHHTGKKGRGPDKKPRKNSRHKI